MRLFIDQMFRVELAEQLQRLGHDVIRASQVGLSRADDAVILSQAIADNRILITLDGHFGNWAVLPLCAHPGVIRVKVHPATTENVIRVLVSLFTASEPSRFPNHLIIASPTRIRWISTAS